ncbi:MAG: hypothetical protein JKX92_01510 [Porticoccaceae bacterium]|nr:hypothetical protein [Porticoccaceae bacterium]
MTANKAGSNTAFEAIEPADIDLSQAPSSESKQPGTGADNITPRISHRPWILGVILLALAGVLALLIATTNQDKSPDPEAKLGDEQQPPAITQPGTVEESPFQSAQLAAARRSAQDILAAILLKQKSLKATNIQQWADEEYQHALAAATEGDRLYRERAFSAAIEHYKMAWGRLDKLEAEREPRTARLLKQGLLAINQGRGDDAQQAFDKILLMTPRHPQALQGKQRCASLPEVFAASEHGRALQIAGEYAAALAQYSLALSLDPLFEAAIQGRVEAQNLFDDEQFQSAINRAYQHLHGGEFATARRHLQRALSLKPQSSVARAALAQVDNEIAQKTIARLLNSAAADESEEHWQSALDTYNQILDRDPAVTGATIGKIRSAVRQQLDARLQNFIHQPLRLATPAVYRDAQQSLTDARQIGQPGPRLQRQVDALSRTLSNAQKPQTVVLRSDKLTRVSIFKFAEFEPFTEKTIQLKPGKYIAEGIRPGYRDVRVEFTVFGADTSPVVVQCRETI